MTTITIDRAVVEQALDFIVATNKSSQFWLVPESNLNKAVTALRAALAQQAEPRNQCGETCERAKLCATCAQALAQQDEPQGCATEEDCTKQPWCRIRGECQRKQAEPVEPVAWLAPDGSVRETPAAKSFGEWVWGPDDFKPLYTAPPQRKPLTSDKDRPDQGTTYVEGYGYVDTRAVRAIEKAHGIGEQP